MPSIYNYAKKIIAWGMSNSLAYAPLSITKANSEVSDSLRTEHVYKSSIAFRFVRIHVFIKYYIVVKYIVAATKDSLGQYYQ